MGSKLIVFFIAHSNMSKDICIHKLLILTTRYITHFINNNPFNLYSAFWGTQRDFTCYICYTVDTVYGEQFRVKCLAQGHMTRPGIELPILWLKDRTANHWATDAKINSLMALQLQPFLLILLNLLAMTQNIWFCQTFKRNLIRVHLDVFFII